MSSSALVTSPSWPNSLAAAAFVVPKRHHINLMNPVTTRPLTTSASTSFISNTDLVDKFNMLHLSSFKLKGSLNDDAPSLAPSSAGSDVDPDELLQLFPHDELQSSSSDLVEERSLRSMLRLPMQPASSVSTKCRRPFIVGHRGALYDELENTVEGFQRCADLGCDAVELDVFLLKDGTLVVFHGGGSDQFPGDLTEYTINHKRKGILNLHTFAETQQIQFNPDFEEFACPPEKIRRGRIPKLSEVLADAKKSGIIVKIELKGPGVTEPVLKLVQEMEMVDQCHYSSFEHDRIALVRKLHPERNEDGTYKYKTGALFHHLPEDFVEQAQRVGASEVHVRYDECTPTVIDAIHSNGMDSMAWFRGPMSMRTDAANKYLDVGNEDSRMYEALLETGVQQMCVNRPDVLVGMFPLQ